MYEIDFPKDEWTFLHSGAFESPTSESISETITVCHRKTLSFKWIGFSQVPVVLL